MEKEVFIDLSKYEIIDKIGMDSNWETFLIKLKNDESEQLFSAKVMRQSIAKVRNVEKELSDISLLDHPSVLKIIGFSPLNFKSEHNPVIITDYFPNNTLQEMFSISQDDLIQKGVDDSKKLIILCGIASGMSYLHSKSILQHILKPENILLDSYLYPKINYFNLSKKLIYHPSYLDITPEGIESNEYSEKSDVFSFAFIAYQLLTNTKPFQKKNLYDIMNLIVQGKRPEVFPSKFNKQLKKLIQQCWSQNPEDRPTFDQIVTEIKTIEKTQEFQDYVNYLDGKGEPKINPLFLSTQNSEEEDIEIETICPKDVFKKLPPKNQEQIIKGENGNDSILYTLSINFLNGELNFPQKPGLGLTYLHKCIINGYELAAYTYAESYLNTENQLEEAKQFIKKNNNDKNPLFEYLKGHVFLKEGNEDEAIKCFTKSANKKYGRAAKKLGEMYRDLKKNNTESQKYFALGKQLNKQGNNFKINPNKVQNNVSCIYKKGMKLLRSYKIKEAIIIFEQDLQNKDCLNSIKKLTEIYFYGFQSIPPNNDKAVTYGKLGIKSSSIDIINILISIYEKNTTKYKPNFADIYSRGANLGDSDSMYKLSQVMFKQKNKSKNKKRGKAQAMIYLKSAANRGNQLAILKYISMNSQLEEFEKINYLKLAVSFGSNKAEEQLNLYKLKNDADNGDLESITSYAKYLIENGNEKAALKYLQKAAENGDSKSKKELTRIKVKQYKNDIKNGDPKGLGKLASILLEHSKYKKNIEEANEYLTKAIQLYDMNAKVDLKNLKELKLLQSNDHEAMFNHANKIEDEEEQNNDQERLKFWYKISADLGNEESMISYAKILDKEVRDNLRDFKNHVTPKLSREEYEHCKSEEELYFKKAAELGNVNGMVNYARILDHKVRDYQNAVRNHRRTKINEQEAYSLQNESAKYYKKAAELGNKSAMNSYGIYLEYRKKNKNQEEAKKWYKKSAEQGFIRGMLNYARVLDQSIRDYRYLLRIHKKPKLTKEEFEEAQSEAAKYYKIAAEQGNRNAMYFFALYLEHGNGIEPDKEKAVEYYRASAEKGNTGAMSNLGRCLEHGIGIDQNKNEALKWYKRASRYGSKKAEQEYQYLLKSMKNDEKIETDDDEDEIKIQDEEEDDDDGDDNNERKSSNDKNKNKVDSTSDDDNDENENDDDDSDIDEIDDKDENNVDDKNKNDNDENENDDDDDDDDDFDMNDENDEDEGDDDVDENEEVKDDDDDDDDDDDNNDNDNEEANIDDDFV